MKLHDSSPEVLSQFVWLGHVIFRKALGFKNQTSVCARSVESCSAVVPIMVCYTRVIFKASCSCNYAI